MDKLTDTTDSSILVLWLQYPSTLTPIPTYHPHPFRECRWTLYRYWVWGQWGLESEVEWYWSQFFHQINLGRVGTWYENYFLRVLKAPPVSHDCPFVCLSEGCKPEYGFGGAGEPRLYVSQSVGFGAIAISMVMTWVLICSKLVSYHTVMTTTTCASM